VTGGLKRRCPTLCLSVCCQRWRLIFIRQRTPLFAMMQIITLGAGLLDPWGLITTQNVTVNVVWFVAAPLGGDTVTVGEQVCGESRPGHHPDPVSCPADGHHRHVEEERVLRQKRQHGRSKSRLVVSHFYRAMHYSAKRGLAIACLSVRLWRWWIVIT